MRHSAETTTIIAAAANCAVGTPIAPATGPAISAPAGIAIIEPSTS